MASVRKRQWAVGGTDGIAWVVDYVDQQGKRRNKNFEKKRDAEQYLITVQGEMRKGEHIAPDLTRTFQQIADAWIEDCWRRHSISGRPAKSTIVTYEHLNRNQLIPAFGSQTISKMTGEYIQDWLEQSAKIYKHGMLRALRCSLNLIMKFAIKSKRLMRNPIVDEQVRIPGRHEPVKVPSKSDISRLLQALEHRAFNEQFLSFYQRRAFVMLGLFGGMRAGEISALKWERIKFDQGKIEIRHSIGRHNGLKSTKTYAGLRDIPLFDAIRTALEDLRRQLGNPTEGYVFHSRTGRPMLSDHDILIWRPLMEKAGLSYPRRRDRSPGRAKFHFHALRHAAVSLLVEQGLNGTQIARFIGHANANITLGIYAHLFPEDDKAERAMLAVSQTMAPVFAPARPKATCSKPAVGAAKMQQTSNLAP